MAVPKRLALAALAALLGGAGAFIPTAVAVAQFPAAGSQTSTTATAFFQTDPSNFDQAVNVEVDVTNNVSMPQGGPRTTSTSVQVTYSFSFLDPSTFSFTFGNGCFDLVDPSQFTMDSKLLTASLDATTGGAQTCGFANGPVPSSINVTWSAASPVMTLGGNQHFACAGYTRQTMSTSSSDAANGTATLPGTLPGSFPSFQAYMRSQTIQTFAQGTVPPDTCAQSIGRGSFGGFPAAGNYRSSVLEADATLFPTDPSTPLVFVTVKRIASTSSPLAGTPSSTNETDVNLFIRSDLLNVSGCFVVDPNGFTASSDLTSTQLNVQLDTGTPACSSGSQVVPLGVAVSWAGPGPISSLVGNSSIACALYHSVSSSSQTINGSPTATITLTIPATETTPATTLGPFSTQGAVATTDSRTQAAGTLDPACSLH